jgi:integrase
VWAQAQTNYAKSMRQGPYLPRRSSLSLPSEQRIPKILNAGDLKKIVQFAPLPYSLIFKWAVTTGLRRMELCKLTTLEFDAISFHGDRNNVMSFDTIRKGGRRVTAYLPAKLFHDTRWYINMSRGLPQSGEERFVFLTPSGCRPHREQVSRVFRQCADQIGSRAIFHHLRHTFAVTALEILQRQANAGSSINPLKTLQLMMGHASIASTEIYLTALDIYSDDVAEALDFLYGASA